MNRPHFFAPSERNKQPILEQLKKVLPARAHVLEIGSGLGQHAIHFCKTLTGLKWQASEKGDSIADLMEELSSAGISNIAPPLALDVVADEWPIREFDAVYAANTAHIMSWEAVSAMFGGTGTILVPGGLFCLYGPFNIDGKYTSEGNRDFDRNLRSRNPKMGIRDLGELERLAGSHQMFLQERISMPANNFLLVFEKRVEQE